MADDILIVSFNCDSPEYKTEVALRDHFLRKPLGLKINEYDLADDSGSQHLGAFKDGKMIGCLILTLYTKEIIRVRQVVIDEMFQSRGIGKRLMAEAENYARANGYQIVKVMARKTAVLFYQKLGYGICSEEFNDTRSGLPHYRMEKILNKQKEVAHV